MFASEMCQEKKISDCCTSSYGHGRASGGPHPGEKTGNPMAPATQGKWGVHQQDGHFYVVNEHGGILAIIDRGRQPEEALANAQLMSAAPLLQASCVELAGALA